MASAAIALPYPFAPASASDELRDLLLPRFKALPRFTGPLLATVLTLTIWAERGAPIRSAADQEPLAGLALLAGRTLHIPDARALPALFAVNGITLDAVRFGDQPLPRWFVKTLPGDFAEFEDPAERKQVFLQAVLPLVLKANEAIREDRARLTDLLRRRAAGSPIAFADRRWLALLAERYGAEPDDANELLARVDEIPPSLVLAQAGTESGWGTSRLAREANALFGQKSFKGTGWRSDEVEDGKPVYYRSFDTVVDGIAAYAHNLNTHWAYADFRAERAALRRWGDGLSGPALVDGLINYSTRRADYIADLRTVMLENRLTDFDGARLDQDGEAVLIDALH